MSGIDHGPGLRVLHLAPLWYPISEDAPGGIETYLPALLGALEEVGCRNTLIASGDSRTEAELLPAIPVHLCEQMERGAASEFAYYEQHQLHLALTHGSRFDVIHSHIGSAAYVLSAVPALQDRVLHTHHNPVYQDLEWFVREHPDVRFSTVSEFQAQKLWRQGARRCEVIPNGIDMTAFSLVVQQGPSLFFIGRMEEEKGADLAVQVARMLDLPLTLAGPVTEDGFFESRIEPFLGDGIRYVGVVDHHRKRELFGQAGCVLMPSRVEEAFGMVSVEAMASGTPVIGLARGSLPEIIEPGLTGFVAASEQQVASLVPAALRLDRRGIRARAEQRFDVRRIALAYRRLYERISGHATRSPAPALR
jgi:glycosyltransferase involved in cell wall biosynthesis